MVWPREGDEQGVFRIPSTILLVWLIIGAIAAGQRHYYSGEPKTCAHAGDTIVTILAGQIGRAHV